MSGAAQAGQTSIEVDGRTLRLSNLDKALRPADGFTKAQVIDYCSRISAVAVPHPADRPLTVVHFPNGVDQLSFLTRNAPSHRPDWTTTAVLPSPGSAKNRSTIDHLIAEDRPTPVTWDEVGACGEPARLTFTAADVLRRVGEHGDLFAPPARRPRRTGWGYPAGHSGRFRMRAADPGHIAVRARPGPDLHRREREDVPMGAPIDQPGTALPLEAPDADTAEQAREIRPVPSAPLAAVPASLPSEVDEFDLVEQSIVVETDEDDYR